ncbi:hypothetical protein ACK303_22400, partial [Aeromonas caviae]
LMMNPVPWLQMTNMISYQGLVRTFPSRQELEAAKILRDLLYKINSISKLISKLREGNVDWNPSEEGVEELKQLLSD